MSRADRNSGDESIVDPDVDLHDPRQLKETARREWDIVLACAVGGVLGAWSRYGLEQLVPHAGSQFPWSTVLINASGCLLIGVLMGVLVTMPSPHRLIRPLLGVGVLGGYTTYSTFAVDAERMVLAHRLGVAAGYVVLTVAACGLAVWLGSSGTHAVRRGTGA